MHAYIDVLFPVLQRTLSDPADEVVQQCLVVIAEVISTPNLRVDTEGNFKETKEFFRLRL